MNKIAITYGDGIGPEIMDSVLFMMKEAGASLDLCEIKAGEKVYEKGHTSGIDSEAWDILRETKVLLKAPITTPRGKGYKSLNVTLRKTLGLFANIRPCKTYHPFIKTNHPNMDVVIVRENEEDTYGGIEHRQTAEVTQCLKLITKPGTEKVVRYAFEYAKQHDRKKVTCFVKDNIMKITDGLFHNIFNDVSKEYPDIEHDTMIVDIGSAKMANNPSMFDVVVMPNLYGDIVSDIAAEITGSVGLVGSSNIGEHCAMFEAIHGSAPDIAGKNIANPSALLFSALLMLDHIGQSNVAETLNNAWLCTIEEGILTSDLGGKYNTKNFTNELVKRIGRKPNHLKAERHKQNDSILEKIKVIKTQKPVKELVGIDVFIDWDEFDRDPNKLGTDLLTSSIFEGEDSKLELTMITNRGTKVFPNGAKETFCTDHWRCRFKIKKHYNSLTHQDLLNLLQRLKQFDVIKTENLYNFDGKPGYSLGQGE